MRARYDALPDVQRDALATAAKRIRAFHEAQKSHGGGSKSPSPTARASASA
jgi:histidinol dehydrogenase